MKTLTLAAIRCSLMFTAVAALSLAYPASGTGRSHHVQLHRQPFTDVSGPYTTSDFVTAMVTLANPLPPNFNGTVTPTAFTFSDGVQTFTNLNADFFSSFLFMTGPTGQITGWDIIVGSGAATSLIHNQPRGLPRHRHWDHAGGFRVSMKISREDGDTRTAVTDSGSPSQ